MLYQILAWMVAGLIIGAIARLLVPGRQSMTLLMTMVLGIVGALLGGLVSWLIWGQPGDPFSAHAWPGYLMGILFAVILLWFFGSSYYRRRHW